MIRMPDWIGSLPKLSALQLYGVRLKEWSLSGFQSLRRLDVLSCNARKVGPAPSPIIARCRLNMRPIVFLNVLQLVGCQPVRNRIKSGLGGGTDLYPNSSNTA